LWEGDIKQPDWSHSLRAACKNTMVKVFIFAKAIIFVTIWLVNKGARVGAFYFFNLSLAINLGNLNFLLSSIFIFIVSDDILPLSSEMVWSHNFRIFYREIIYFHNFNCLLKSWKINGITLVQSLPLSQPISYFYIYFHMESIILTGL